MQVLGRDVGARIDPWFHTVNGQVGSANRTLDIRAGRKGSFGATGEEGDAIVVAIADDLAHSALEHTFAHELAHVQQILERYPVTQRPPGISADTGESLVGVMTAEVVLGPDAEERIAHLNLDTSWEDKQRSTNIRRRINEADAGEGHVLGSFHFTHRALTYAWGELVWQPKPWLPLRRKFQAQLPAAARAGRDVVSIVKRHGWKTPEAAFQAMTEVIAHLQIGEFVLVFNRLDGSRYQIKGYLADG